MNHLSPILSTLLAGLLTAVAAAEPGPPPVPTEAGLERLDLARSPAVETILTLPRDTPAAKLRAVIALVDLGESPLARPILTELAGMQLTPDQQAELVNEFGSYRMLDLAQDPILADVAGPFTQSCMAAAAAQSRDPQRLQAVVSALGSADPQLRVGALIDLNAAGIEGVQYAIAALAASPAGADRRGLLNALVATEPLSVGPLLAVLNTTRPALQEDAIRVLGELQVTQALPLLAAEAVLAPRGSPVAQVAQQAVEQMTGQAATPQLAARLLAADIARYQAGVPPFESGPGGQILLWHWDDDSGTLTAQLYEPAEAALVWSARLAEDLYRLNPTDAANRRLALLTNLEAARLRQGYDAPLEALALSPTIEQATQLEQQDPDSLNRLLSDALKHDSSGAAITACQLLAAAGEPGVLYTADGTPSPLAEALRADDRRVVFAALQAILAIDPAGPFPGSSRVAKALAYFARGGGQPVALVAHPRLRDAASVGGMLAGLGYQPQSFDTGYALIQAARDASDAQFIVVDMFIVGPTIRETLYNLRSLPTPTAGVPIGLLAPPGRELEAQSLAAEHTNVVAYARPYEIGDVEDLVIQLQTAAGHRLVPDEERAGQAAFATQAIGQLLAQGNTFYDLRAASDAMAQGLYEPELADEVIASLALLCTPQSQRMLTSYASQSQLPIAARRAAANAFRQSVERNGILLTTNEILHQYDVYNASATADEATQQLLGGLLDTLESRRAD